MTSQPAREPAAAESPHDAAERTLSALREAALTVASAESLTGGLVTATLTDVPGASAVVRGGVISYATDVKEQVLGVDAQLLADGGAVQADVARQMAVGVCRLCSSDLGVATTGVAGPEAQDGHAVGTVFVAVARRGQAPEQVEVRPLVLVGDRQQIRRQTVAAALGLLTEVVADVVAETVAGTVPGTVPGTVAGTGAGGTTGAEDSGSDAR
jgi:nicotinamide-nucleotide amidase